MATNIGDLFVRVGADTDGLNRGLRDATRATRRMARTSGQNLRRISVEAQRAVPPVGRLTGALGALSGALSAREVIRYADAWQNAANQLRQVTDSSGELEAAQRRLMRVANETRSDFASTAGLYARLSRSTTELGLDTEDLIGLTRTINQAFTVSGATAEEASAAITQLSQGLAAGALRGDEFNSVAEQAPALMRAIAESLDMTIGNLREFAAEGGITAEIVVNALQEASDSIEENFGKAVATFGQQMTVARNNMREFIGTSSEVESTLGAAGDGLVALSENLDQVANVAQAAAGLFAGRLVGSMAAASSGMTAATAAANGLRASMAFLGGPIGILVGAGGLLFAFREELGLVAEKAGLSADEIDKLTQEAEDLSVAARENRIGDLSRALEEATLKAAAAREQLAQLRIENRGSGVLGMEGGEFGKEIRGMQAVAEAQEKILEINQRMQALQSGRKFGPLSDFLFPTRDGGGGTDEEDGGGGDVPGGTGQGPDAAQQFRQQLEQRINMLRESSMTELEILREKDQQRLSQIQEMLEQEKISKQEAMELERQNEQLHQEELTAIARRSAEERARVEQRAEQAKMQIRDRATSAAVGLLNTLGQKNKAFALAAIAVTKGLAIAQTLAHTQTAAMLAYSSQLIPGDPTSYGRAAAAYAKTQAMGKVAAGLIAAQGIAQAAGTLSGGGSSGGGGGAVAAGGSGSTAPAPQPQQQAPVGGTLTVRGLSASSLMTGDAVAELAEELLEYQRNGGRVVFQ